MNQKDTENKVIILDISLKRSKMELTKLSTMVGENSQFQLYQIAINGFKLSTVVGENFEFYSSQIAINAFKLSTMFGAVF